MPVSEFHRQVAAIALAAAARHGFALAGGNALMAHGIIDRPTEDVDLFTDQETGVEAAADEVEVRLRDACFEAERQDNTAALGDIFPGMDQGLAEWIVTAPGGEQTMLQMAYFDRARGPVTMDIGPVLDLEDVLGGKVCALALLTELTKSRLAVLGQMSVAVTTFLGHEPRGDRTRLSCSSRPAPRETTRDQRPVESLSAA
jgi:hypothetical protein